jgi:hypothetical protein
MFAPLARRAKPCSPAAIGRSAAVVDTDPITGEGESDDTWLATLVRRVVALIASALSARQATHRLTQLDDRMLRDDGLRL